MKRNKIQFPEDALTSGDIMKTCYSEHNSETLNVYWVSIVSTAVSISCLTLAFGTQILPLPLFRLYVQPSWMKETQISTSFLLEKNK